MTIGYYIDFAFLVIGSFILAVLLLQGMWYFIGYVFLGGDDAERAHLKGALLHTSINLMFFMILWGVFSIIGTVIGL